MYLLLKHTHTDYIHTMYTHTYIILSTYKNKCTFVHGTYRLTYKSNT